MLESGDFITAYMEKNRQAYLVSSSDLSTKQFFAFGRQESDYKVTFKKIENISAAEVLQHAPWLMDHFLYSFLRKSIPNNFRCEGSVAYDISADLLTGKEVKSTNALLSNLAVYPAVTFSINHYGEKIYIHLSPTTRILSKASIHRIQQNADFSKDIVKYVRLDLGKISRFAEIKEITELHSDVKINSEAFGNRNFLEFARANYPDIQLNDPKAKLAIVIPSGSSNSWVFSSEAMYPSFNFQAIDALDPKFFKSLLGIIKARSVARLENARQFVTAINPLSSPCGVIEINETPFTSRILVNAPFLHSNKIDERNLERLSVSDDGAVFEAPSISLRVADSKGTFSEKTIYPGIDRKFANLNDLMKWPNLAPLEPIPEIKICLIVDKKLENQWSAEKENFKQALLKGVNNYKYSFSGFEQTFKCPIVMLNEFIVGDFFGAEFEEVVKKISPANFDCIILIIPRWLESALSSKQIYLVPKEKIMQKGVPVQVIANDPTRVKGTLKDKVRDPFVMFGLALNIAAKPGYRLTAFSKEFADKIIGNSVVMGYNITRITPKLRSLEQNSTLEERMGKTIPLVAPLFIIDNRGSRILHWNFYQPTSEVTLFSEFGDKIFNKIPNDVQRVIIHKDGPFKDNELKVLESFNTADRKVIPISITQSNALRMHNASHIGVGNEIQRGVFLKLDNRNFELATTTIQSWDATNWGWPHPIHVRIHANQEYVQNLKLLYHIFALTKMHFGSQRPTRAPISIHYANMVSTFLRALGDEAPSFHQSFEKVFNEKGRMPLWFL